MTSQPQAPIDRAMWVKLDDSFPDHPKVEKVGPAGLVLHVRMTCYCARFLTDGFVPDGMAAKMASDLPKGTIQRNMDVRVPGSENGLLERVPDGFQVHDYLEYNPSREKVMADREMDRARNVAGGQSRAAKATRDGGKFTSQKASRDTS